MDCILAARLFALGLAGVLVRRNWFSCCCPSRSCSTRPGWRSSSPARAGNSADGQVMFIFILAMAAAEVSVGLALAAQLYHRLQDPRRRRRQPMRGLIMLAPAVADSLLFLWSASSCWPWSAARLPRAAAIAWWDRLGRPVGAVAFVVAVSFLLAPAGGHAFTPNALDLDRTSAASPPRSRFYLDPLSLVMVLVVTLVGFLILLYSAGVHGRRGGIQPLLRLHEPVRRLDARSWCWPTTCCFSTLGWEGVGLCSYLLIGFWYATRPTARAARKAFIVTRVGDTALRSACC